MSRFIDMTGQAFNRWTFMNFQKFTPQGTMWECKCSCGTTKTVLGKNIKSGKSKSCGCLVERSAEITTKTLYELLSYDHETGIFKWKVDRQPPVKAGDEAGHLKTNGYIVMSVDGHACAGHRLAWFFVYGEWPKNEIDHIDGNRSNNAISNLRDVTKSINQQNIRSARKHNKSSGLLGVTKDRNAWVCRIKLNGKTYHSRHKSKEAAALTYLNAKRQLHEGNTL